MKDAILIALAAFYVFGIGGTVNSSSSGAIKARKTAVFLTIQFTILAAILYVLLG